MALYLILLDRKYESFLWGLPWGLWQSLSPAWIISTRDQAAEELTKWQRHGFGFNPFGFLSASDDFLTICHNLAII